MNEINFIPQQYRQRQQRRRNLARQLTLLTLAGVCLAGWAVFQHHRTAELRNYAQSLERQVAGKRNRLQALKSLQNEYQQLQRQARMQQRLAQSLSHTRIVTALGQLLPEDVAVQQLTMVTQRAEANPGDTSDSTASLASQIAPTGVQVRFEAIAPPEVAVAKLVGRLSEHPVFSEVTLRQSQTEMQKDQRVVRFQLEMAVDLQRRFKLTDQPEGGGPHAG
jgi:Tfp pilus assembly protein PilN